jgi:PAS domain S-box-containing protein
LPSTPQSLSDLLPHLRTLLDATPVGLVAFDLDLRCLTVNTAFAALSGRTVEAYVGQYATDVLPWTTDATVRILAAVADAGEACTGQRVRLPVPERPGELRDYDVGYHPAVDGSGTVVGVTVLVSELPAGVMD